MPEKFSPSYIMAVIGAAIYVYTSQKDMPFLARLLKVSGAVFIGVSVEPDLTDRFGAGEKLTLIASITLSWVVIDAAATLVAKHKDLLDLIRKVTGK